MLAQINNSNIVSGDHNMQQLNDSSGIRHEKEEQE